jgi:hypothetical protein
VGAGDLCILARMFVTLLQQEKIKNSC